MSLAEGAGVWKTVKEASLLINQALQPVSDSVL